MTDRELMQQALEAVEQLTANDEVLITALRARLAQPDPEPVLGAKTWFEDGKVVTQYLTAADIYISPQPDPEKFCDVHCVWTDHHPDCTVTQPEPVAFAFVKNGKVLAASVNAGTPTMDGGRWEPLYLAPQPIQPALVAAAERDKLRAFAQAVMTDWPEYAGIDGFDLQDIAVEHGLLESTVRHEPCGEGCNCAWYAEPLPHEWRKGVTCYRKTALLGDES